MSWFVFHDRCKVKTRILFYLLSSFILSLEMLSKSEQKCIIPLHHSARSDMSLHERVNQKINALSLLDRSLRL